MGRVMEPTRVVHRVWIEYFSLPRVKNILLPKTLTLTLTCSKLLYSYPVSQIQYLTTPDMVSAPVLILVEKFAFIVALI